jgi:hypothetical protein
MEAGDKKNKWLDVLMRHRTTMKMKTDLLLAMLNTGLDTDN